MLIALINLLKGDNIKVSHNNLWRESMYGTAVDIAVIRGFIGSGGAQRVYEGASPRGWIHGHWGDDR